MGHGLRWFVVLMCLVATGAEAQVPPPLDAEVSLFVRRIFQDTRGDLWLGTNGDGVARYDREDLEYFSVEQGFGGAAVRGIVEDADGNVWFGTSGGLTRYDGQEFTNYTKIDGLPHDDVWALTIDRDGGIWIGTLGGACRFDGATFQHFFLPEGPPDPLRGVTSSRIVHAIFQDSRGRIWFGTNAGVWILDDGSLSNLSEADGLCNDAVNDIVEDHEGNIWFATHHNGVCRWNGTNFTHFDRIYGIEGTEAWSFLVDADGGVWFPIENSGVYRFDGEVFANLSEADGLPSNAIQTIHQDHEGRMWFGGYRGLARLDGDTVVRVRKEGPWQ